MQEFHIVILLSSIIAAAAPIVLASLGETITEKAGIINLSLDGTILLGAMIAFAVTYNSHNILLGFLAGGLAGAFIASIVGLFSIYLNISQVAVGFVLTLTARDLAYFLGNPYSRIYGPQTVPIPVPFLHKLPIIGTIFFQHPIPVYLSIATIFIIWWYMYYTSKGLHLRCLGENPHAVYARGFDPRRLQMIYTVIGGFFVGLAGATFSLCTKPGWGRPQGAEGTGWIALAIVIFGGWHPLRVAMGAYLFAFLQVIGISLQGILPSVPAQVFQVAPFPLMILALLIPRLFQTGSNLHESPSKGSIKKRIIKIFLGSAPASLGKPFQPK